MRFSSWCRLWRVGGRHGLIAQTEVVNPILTESQQAQANQISELLLCSYLDDFLVEVRSRNSAFTHPCYFFARALRVPVWVTLHRLIFNEPWAGRFRSYDLARGFACDEFCPASKLIETAHRVMHRLRVQAKTLGSDPARDSLVDFLARMHTWLNYVHPFADGNGRLQRLYMNFVAGYYGWLIDWSQINRDAYLEAVRLAFRQDREPLCALLDQALVSLQEVE